MRTRHRTSVPGIYYRTDAQGIRRYIIWYKDARGRAHTETLGVGYTLEDAKLRHAALRTRRFVPTKMKVGELLDEWLDRRTGISPATLAVYTWAVGVLKSQIGNVVVTDLTADMLADLRREYVHNGYKKHSISKIETPLRMALKEVARNGHIAASPFDKLLSHERVRADQKEMRCLSSDEVSALMSSSSGLSESWQTLFATLIFTGLRISEALSLEWSDVDLQRDLIHVRKGKTPAARRSVMLMASMRRVLTGHKLAADPGTDRVFPVSHSGARDALNAACKRADVPRCNLHTLRHTYASILIDQGEPVTFVSEQMGHASPDLTLKVYSHLFNAQGRIDQARERLQAAYGGLI